MQLTRPFRKGRFRPDKGSTARSYQNTRPAGRPFQGCLHRGEKKKNHTMVVEEELVGEGKLDQEGPRKDRE